MANLHGNLVRIAWIAPLDIELIGFGFFNTRNFAREFLEDFYQYLPVEDSIVSLTPFPSYARPRHFGDRVVAVDRVGWREKSKVAELGEQQSWPIFVSKYDDTDLWGQARHGVLLRREQIRYRLLPPPAKLIPRATTLAMPRRPEPDIQEVSAHNLGTA